MLSRRLDQSETPARLTTRLGGGACAQLLREEAERRWERPTKLPTWRWPRVCVRVCVCVRARPEIHARVRVLQGNGRTDLTKSES